MGSDPKRAPHSKDEQGMGEDCCCFFTKDAIILRHPKKYPLVFVMVLLALVMISGVYVTLVSLKQNGFLIGPSLITIERIQQPCHVLDSQNSDTLHLHYPVPTTYSRNECACTPVQFFAILSMQRSGSGWFETLLNSHVNISSNGEIFSVKERRSNMSTIAETLDKVYNLDWYSSASRNECTAAVGFKWMLNQGIMKNHDEIVEYFKRRGVCAIFLFRRNLLRRMVSILANLHDRDTKQLNGTHKAHVHSKHEANILAKYKPTVNITSLIRELKQADKWGTDALRYFNSTCHNILYYEDLVNNTTKAMDVLELLRVPQRKLVSRHVRIHTGSLSDQIENWDAVYKELNGTKYESFLRGDF